MFKLFKCFHIEGCNFFFVSEGGNLVSRLHEPMSYGEKIRRNTRANLLLNKVTKVNKVNKINEINKVKNGSDKNYRVGGARTCGILSTPDALDLRFSKNIIPNTNPPNPICTEIVCKTNNIR